MAKAKKRSLVELRKFIEERSARDNAVLNTPGNTRPQQLGNAGNVISGSDLQRTKPKIDLVQDPLDRKKIEHVLTSFTKYAALGMLLDEKGPWAKKYPEIVQQIAEEATAMDSAAETMLLRRDVPGGTF